MCTISVVGMFKILVLLKKKCLQIIDISRSYDLVSVVTLFLLLVVLVQFKFKIICSTESMIAVHVTHIIIWQIAFNLVI